MIVDYFSTETIFLSVKKTETNEINFSLMEGVFKFEDGNSLIYRFDRLTKYEYQDFFDDYFVRPTVTDLHGNTVELPRDFYNFTKPPVYVRGMN
jgi:hypothetical protein